MLQGRDLGLIDSENRRSLNLGHSTPLNWRDDLSGQLGLRQQIVGLRKVEVREYIPATGNVISIGMPWMD